jgi:asparagine synthase (glutamine-hydrolysing)
VALGHTRLKITGERGTQPLWSEDRSLVALVNGEFYDHQPLRATFSRNGYRFQTDTDSELLLPLYQKYGMDAVYHLEGEFAFVLWDRNKNLLWSVRDRAGVKPLRFSQGPHGLMFASETQALMAAGIPAAWDETAVLESFSLQYPRPDRTLFSGIGQLCPGESRVWRKDPSSAGGWRAQSARHWAWFDQPQGTVADGDVDFQVEDVLNRAVARRLDTPWPVAVHLSGGLDSTTLLALATEQPHPVTAFGVGFGEKAGDVLHDESDIAQQTAQTLGVDFVRIDGEEGDVVGDWIEAVQHLASPAINGHVVAKWRLNRAIHKAGFRLAMTGEGSDEVFLGYPFFKPDGVRMNLWQEDPRLMVQNAVSAGVMLPSGPGLDLGGMAGVTGELPTWLLAKATLGHRLRALLQDDFIQATHPDTWAMDWAKGPLPEWQSHHTLLQKAATSWATRALGGYILPTLGDGTEGAFGIEGRTPFLDREVMDLGARLSPAQTRDGHGREKAPLRRLLQKRNLGHVATRAKHPFEAPPLWSRDKTRAILRDRWMDGSAFRDLPFVDPARVRQMVMALDSGDAAFHQLMEPVVAFLLSMDALSGLVGKA